MATRESYEYSVVYLIVDRLDSESSHNKKKTFVSLWMDMNVNQTYYGNHFTIYTNIESYCISEVHIILCQLYLNFEKVLINENFLYVFLQEFYAPCHWSWQWFYGYDTQSVKNKSKINKWDDMKLKHIFRTARVTINKMERQTNEEEKIFAKHLISGQHLKYIGNSCNLIAETNNSI